LPSGTDGGDKPREELPLSAMSSEEAVESGEEIEKEEELEEKSHVDMNCSSAMAARKANRVLKFDGNLEFLSRNLCFLMRELKFSRPDSGRPGLLVAGR
jgi:hypothetical protein